MKKIQYHITSVAFWFCVGVAVLTLAMKILADIVMIYKQIKQ